MTGGGPGNCLEWKTEGVTDGESEGGDCAQDEVNQESEQDEVDGMKKGADSTGEVMHI